MCISTCTTVSCTTNPLGVKGAGEAGAIGAPPAVINAIVDALYPYTGVKHIDMPATAASIWAVIEENRGKRAALGSKTHKVCPMCRDPFAKWPYRLGSSHLEGKADTPWEWADFAV